MASPVEFRQFTPKNSRDDLIRRLHQAPEEHVEALLSAYELLERVHEKGLIDIANGLLSASETLIDRLVDVSNSRQAVTALRLLLMLVNLLNSVDPDGVRSVLFPAKETQPSLRAIGKRAMSSDARRGLVAALGLLEVFGRALSEEKTA
jgi:uncharacterized protein YjgD (DUF1641 family)